MKLLIDIESILREDRKFPPSAEFAQQAAVKRLDEYEMLYRRAEQDPEGFWGECARELAWFKPFDSGAGVAVPVCQMVPRRRTQRLLQLPRSPSHRPAPQQGRAHLGGRARRFARAHLPDAGDGGRRAAPMRSRASASRKGDRVAIYMPLVPEAAIAMLACARIGAIHSVIFGGFSAEALVDRINDAEAKLVITADAGWRRGQKIDLKRNVDEALEALPFGQQMPGAQSRRRTGRDAPGARRMVGAIWSRSKAPIARPSRSIPSIRFSRSIPQARPVSPKASSIRPAAI